jgi:hypothetical protein
MGAEVEAGAEVEVGCMEVVEMAVVLLLTFGACLAVFSASFIGKASVLEEIV